MLKNKKWLTALILLILLGGIEEKHPDLIWIGQRSELQFCTGYGCC